MLETVFISYLQSFIYVFCNFNPAIQMMFEAGLLNNNWPVSQNRFLFYQLLKGQLLTKVHH